MYGQLNQKLTEQTEFNQAQDVQLESRSHLGLNREESKAAKKINTLAEQNASILFGDMEQVDATGLQLPPEAHQKAVLQDLEEREKTAGRKERKRLQAQREEILQDGITKVRQRLEEELDAQVDRAAQSEKTAYAPRLYDDTLEGMKVNICADYGVSAPERQEHLQRLQTVQTQAKTLQRNFCRAAFADKVLGQKLGTQAKRYTANKLHTVQGEREALDENFTRYSRDYSTTFHGTVATQEQVERYQQRIETHKEFAKVDRAAAEAEIQRRAITPVTIRGLPAAVEAYKRRQAPFVCADQSTMAETHYDEEMPKIMAQVNEQIAQVYPDKEPLSQEQAEALAKRYLLELLERSDYRFRCSAEVFSLVAQDKMKTQMETGSSGAAFNQSLRKRFSERSFGAQPGTLDATEYENYGYVASPHLRDINTSKTRFYGMVAVKLNKQRMAGRTSCTLADSLNKRAECTPSSADDPDLACVPTVVREALILKAFNKYEGTQHLTERDANGAEVGGHALGAEPVAKTDSVGGEASTPGDDGPAHLGQTDATTACRDTLKRITQTAEDENVEELVKSLSALGGMNKKQGHRVSGASVPRRCDRARHRGSHRHLSSPGGEAEG